MSPGQMRTQRIATARNSNSESMIRALLTIFGEELLAGGHLVASPVVESQVRWQSELNSDVWDHRFTGLDVDGGTWSIWCQTTNYKGHARGRTESNKTYEVRETLTEALTIRATWPDLENHRTFHFTVGPADYTYGWFAPMKSQSFDLSLTLVISETDIFAQIDALLATSRTESLLLAEVYREIESRSPLGRALRSSIDAMLNWWIHEGHSSNKVADAQAQLIREAIPGPDAVDQVIEAGTPSGFKSAVVESILAGQQLHDDPAIEEAVKQTLSAKPFLASAPQHVREWSAFCDQIEEITDSQGSVQSAILDLWQAEDSRVRESIRRVLIRLRPQDQVDYIQDVDVVGLSEHNLYGPRHSEGQASAIAQIIESHLPPEVVNATDLITCIMKEGRQTLREQIYFEARNGTHAAMSFRAVSQMLTSDGYVVKPASCLARPLVGYQRDLCSETVRPYTNFRVIKDRHEKDLAIIKVKHFSAREFDRRCKEEGFVGLSLSKRWVANRFVAGLKLPLIMFIDVDETANVSSVGVAKLMAMGWYVVIGYPALKKLVKTLGE